MLASIITPADIRSSFEFVVIVGVVFSFLPFLRFKDSALSSTVCCGLYFLLCIWSWFIESDAGSSACPEFSAYLWPIISWIVGYVYLVSHLDLGRKCWVQRAFDDSNQSFCNRHSHSGSIQAAITWEGASDKKRS